jgi:acyl-CoA thioesterase
LTDPRPSGDLDRDTALRCLGAGRYEAVIGPEWWVDRGPNGGFLAALVLRAAREALGDVERLPCSLTLHYITAPGEGGVLVEVEPLRLGRRVSNCLVRLSQEERPVVVALVAVSLPGAPTEAGFDATEFPGPPPPDTLDPLPVSAPGVPRFLANYDVRLALGHLPFSGAPEALTGVWIRMASPRRPDVLAVAAFVDGWAHAPLVRLRAPAPTPTIDLTVHFRDHDWYRTAEVDAFVLLTYRSRLLNDGLFEEDGEVWSPQGTLLAQSRQLGRLLAGS